MVKSRRPATAGISRPPGASPGSWRPPSASPTSPYAARPPSASPVLPPTPRNASPTQQAALPVRPLSAFRIPAGWSNTNRNHLSWNDSAILHTEEGSPVASNRRDPSNSLIPLYVAPQVPARERSVRLEDANSFKSPKYSSLKAVPEGKSGLKEQATDQPTTAVACVSEETQTRLDCADQSIQTECILHGEEETDMVLPGAVDESLDSFAVAVSPIKPLLIESAAPSILCDGETQTQTQINSTAQATQTEFSVSLVRMIETALESATSVQPDPHADLSGRRVSLPTVMDAPVLQTALPHPSLASVASLQPTSADGFAQTDPLPELDLARQPTAMTTTTTTAECGAQTTDSPRRLTKLGSTMYRGLGVEAEKTSGLELLPPVGDAVLREVVVLKVTVVEASDLVRSKVYGLSDPYCIVHVEGVTKRTKIVASTQDPLFDAAFTFCIKSFESVVSLAVMDKHATKENKLMGMVELTPSELLARVCDGPDQHEVQADAWVLLQNRAGIPAGGRVLVRLSTSDWTPLDKSKPAPEVVRLADLAGNCLSRHLDEEGEEQASPLAASGESAGGGGGNAPSQFTGSMRSMSSMSGHHHAAAAILEDPADLIDLFEGEKPLEEGIDQGYYPERSCYLFGRDSVVRHRVFGFVSGHVFQVVSWVAAATACFAMGLEPEAVSLDRSVWSALEFASYVVLAVEIALKSIAFGFASKSSSFVFSAVWNVIDLIAFISFWVEFLAPTDFQADFTLRPFRFFRILSPLAQFEVFTGLTAIFLSLKTAFWPFATVIAFLILFFLGFGIFGVTFYHHSYSRRCVDAATLDVMVPARGCKLYDSGESSCSAGETCVTIEGNEMGSVVNFDHITTAFVSIFQAISLDGQQFVMNGAIQGEPRYAPLGLLFFLLLTFFCRFLLFNLCVAVITTTFQEVRKDVSAALAALHSGADTSMHGSQETIAGAPSLSSELSPMRGAASPAGTARARRKRGMARRNFHDITLGIVTSPLFEVGAMTVVLLNTVAMARQAVGISESESRLLDSLELVTQFLFVVELLLRMLGSNSLPEFFSRGHDKFDFFVILLTGMCLFARLLGISKERLGLLATFSALRFIRLVSVIPSINHLLTLTLASVTNIINLLFFTFAFFSVFAVCAVFIFGSNPDDVASLDYANYWTAMRTLFAIFIGDDWRMNLYAAMQHGIETADWWRTLMPCGFVIAFFFFSQAVLTNLYIAVIIENFSVATTKEVRHDPVMQEKLRRAKHFAKRVWKALFALTRPFIVSSKVADINIVRRMYSSSSMGSMTNATGRHGSGVASITLTERSLFVFAPDHPVRAWCRHTAESSGFQNLILTTIFLSMAALAIEPPARDIESAVPYVLLDAINYVSTIVFCVEFVVQAINLGLLLAPHSYFTSAWNTCDFIVLVLSVMDILGGNTKQARVLRLGRALRPLRLIKRNQGMRLMVDALLATWKPVSMIVILAFAVATIFAIMGMSLFKGRFSTCSDPHLSYPAGRDDCVGWHVRSHGVVMPSAWLVPEENFDSFTKAMMQCLTMNTMQWKFLMRMASDVTEHGKAPATDAKVENVFFLVIYLIIGGLFVMNLFVAFIIDGFNQLRKVDAKNIENLANYDVFLSLVRRSSPHRQHPLPRHPLRVAIAKRVLPSRHFTTATTLCVFLNVFFLALYHPGHMSPQMQSLYDLQNAVFFVLMIVEAALILAGRGWLNYLGDSWNWIDIISISASCVAYFVPESAFVRSFRLVKILRIIKNVKALQAMFETLARSIPQFTNVMLLLFLILTMFAILCVNLFGLVREGPLLLGSPVAAWPSTRPTFKSYPVAMYTLFLVTQGEEWNRMVYDAAVQAPACTERFEGKDYGDCGIPVMWSFLIFFGFKLLAEFVLINLFVGMIIDTFTASNSQHVAVQFHFDVGSSTESVKNSANAKKRGSVFKASVSPNSTKPLTRPGMKRGGSMQRQGSVRVRRQEETLSCTDCWQRMTGGGRQDFIQIEDVQVLMRMLPQPLGFARDALGVPTVTRFDRAVCKLIWAELNILAVQRSAGTQGLWRRWGAAASKWLGMDAPVPTETGRVTFDEAFLTLFHWRCPHLVPEEVRRQREPMLEEVVKTAHAVSISRHIRRWLAICKMRKAHKSEGGQRTGGLTTALMLAESRHGTQEDMKRNVEKKKVKLTEKGVGRQQQSGEALRVMGALRHQSFHPDAAQPS